MAAVLEARAIITAVDDTGKAFSSLKERIAGINKQAEAINRVFNSVGSVSKNVDSLKIPSSSVSDMAKLAETASRVDKAMADVSRSSATMAGNVGKTSAEVVGLSAKLMEAGAKLKGIQDFRVNSRAARDADLAARQAQQEARILAAKVDSSPNPTRSVQGAYARALGEVRETDQALKKQVETVEAARKTLSELGVPLNRLSAEEAKLKTTVEETNAALLRQIELEHQEAGAAKQAATAQKLSAEQHARVFPGTAHGREHSGHGFTEYALTSAALAVSAHEIAHKIGEAWHEGAELQHERIGLQNAGRTPEELKEIESASRKTIQALPTSGFTENMKVIAETTPAFGSVHHAIENLPFMMKTMAVLKAAGGEHIKGSVGDVGRAFAKTFEERQTRPEDFEKEARQMIPAMVVSGGTFNPQELYMFAQQAKSALPSLSMRFLAGIAPSLIGAQGGERAGTALNAFESVISGKANDKKQAEEWMKLGLLDPKMAIMKAGHVTSWKSGAVKDTFLAMTDPLAWSEKYLIPALQKQGVDTENREAVKQILDTMFRNQNANVLASEITQAASRARLHKDEDLYKLAGNLDEIYNRDLGDFGVAAGAFTGSLKNLAAATTAPMMHGVATSLSWLAKELNQLSAWGFQHPRIASTAGLTAAGGALAIAGWLGKMLYSGFGLKGSAVALTGAAEALDGAAARLGAAGGLPGGGAGGKIGTIAEGAGGAVLAEKITEAERAAAAVVKKPIASRLTLPEIAASGLMLGGIAGGAWLIGQAAEAQKPGMGGPWAPATAPTQDLDKARLADMKTEKDELEHDLFMSHVRAKDKDAFNPVDEQKRQRIGELNGFITALESSLKDIYVSPDLEDSRGRGYANLKPVEYFGPEMPPELIPKKREPFGPFLPPESTIQRVFNTDGNVLHRVPGDEYVSPMPVPNFPKAPEHIRPVLSNAGAPVPVAIVSSVLPTSAAPPSVAHDPWNEGDRPGIEERARRGAAMFRQYPEVAHGAAMMQYDHEHPDITPHVDTGNLDELKTKTDAAHEALAALAALTVTLNINGGAVDALTAKLLNLKNEMSSLGSVSAGKQRASLGPSYPAAAPTGRMGGPR